VQALLQQSLLSRESQALLLIAALLPPAFSLPVSAFFFLSFFRSLCVGATHPLPPPILSTALLSISLCSRFSLVFSGELGEIRVCFFFLFVVLLLSLVW
jgi:hypothetical protein